MKLIRAGQKLELKVHIEVHRDTATETPEKFEEIARLYQRATGELMPVTWDHSHFAREQACAPERLLGAAAGLAENSFSTRSCFICAPFNSQHCQVPILNRADQLTPEFKDYLGFVEDLFVVWLQGPGGRAMSCGPALRWG